MKVLVLNCGSSSVKFQLIEMGPEKVLARGLADRVGLEGGKIELKYGSKKEEVFVNLASHDVAIQKFLKMILDKKIISSLSKIEAVGHRIVHGGDMFKESVLITEEVLESIKACIPLAPLHNPANISGIEACTFILGDVPQVAVFDTAFHQCIEEKVYTYAIDSKIAEREKIRKYGFHGTSYRYIYGRYKELVKIPRPLVVCHLGNGSSICAISEEGFSMDTSMGLTPVEGLMMGTRCGDIDPGVVLHLVEKVGLEKVNKILNKESGLKGISGFSDMREVLKSAKVGREKSNLALEIFCYRVAKYIGAYMVTLGCIPDIIFTGGIGENSPYIRLKIMEELEFLGLYLEKENNLSPNRDSKISTSESNGSVWVLKTNEELMIAQDTMKVIEAQTI